MANSARRAARRSAEHRRRPWRAARRSAEHRAAAVAGGRSRQSIGRRVAAVAIVIIPPARAASPLSAEGPTGPVVSIVILGHLLKYTTQSAVVKSGGKIHHRPAAAARRSEVAAELRAADNWRAAVTIGRASGGPSLGSRGPSLGRASGGGRGGRPWSLGSRGPWRTPRSKTATLAGGRLRVAEHRAAAVIRPHIRHRPQNPPQPTHRHNRSRTHESRRHS